MAGTAYRKGGPETYSPAQGEVVHAGRLVEAVTGGRIKECTAAAVRHLGVAITDAIAPEDVGNGQSVDTLGRLVINAFPVPTNTAVAHGETHRLTYTANAAFGEPLVCTGAGKVGPAGATPTQGTVIGRCVEPGGVVFATNPIGLTRVSL